MKNSEELIKNKKQKYESEIKSMIDNKKDYKEINDFINKKIYFIEYDTINRTNNNQNYNERINKVLQDKINFIINNSSKYDKVILHVSSPGGSVIQFSEAFYELKRIKDKGIELIITIDSVAASGG